MRDINTELAKERISRLELEEKFEIQQELLSDISKQYIRLLSKIENHNLN